MASPYLNITGVTAGQNNKEVTINDADLALEQATQTGLTVNMAAGNVTLTVSQFTRNHIFLASGLTADRELTVPTNMGAGANTGRRMFIVKNPTIYRVTVKVSGQSTPPIVPPLSAGIFFMDGTIVQGVIIGAADTRRHDVSFFFPGELVDDTLMVRYVFAQNAYWPVNIPDSQINVNVAPSGGDIQFIIKKNGLVIGAIDVADSTLTGTFDHPTATSWAPGDVLEIWTDPVDMFGLESPAITLVGYLT